MKRGQQPLVSCSSCWANFLREIPLSTVRPASRYLVNAFQSWRSPHHRPRTLARCPPHSSGRYSPHHSEKARTFATPKGAFTLRLVPSDGKHRISNIRLPACRSSSPIVATYFHAGRNSSRKKQINGTDGVQEDGLLRGTSYSERDIVGPAADRTDAFHDQTLSVGSLLNVSVERVEQ